MAPPDSAPAVRSQRDFEEYRAHVGPADRYDVFSATQFNLLTSLGLRDEHHLLDIGCGSLRAGRLFIPYLREGCYFGIEPLPWLIKEGINNELGEEIIRLKKPTFSNVDDFTLSTFDTQFDFIIAQSIFSHATQAQISKCMAEARKVMKPDAVFAASFFEGTENYTGNTWTAKAEYTMERMRELVEEQGLVFRQIDWRHPDLQRWFLVFQPGTLYRLPDITDLDRVMRLEEDLRLAHQQLMSIRSHPYVRFGMMIKFLLVTLTFAQRRLLRALRGGDEG